MMIDLKRFKLYLIEITRNSDELKKILAPGTLSPDSLELKAAKNTS